MRLSDIITEVRRKVGEPYTANTRWPDTDITDTVNEVKRRIHWDYARANPEAFRATLDVTLPADTYETQLNWSRNGPPAIWGPVYDITSSSTPGQEVVVVPRSMKDVQGVGVSGRTFYTTPDTFGEAKTFRLVLVENSQNLANDDDEPTDLPEDLQYDLLVYGTAIELQAENPDEVPALWLERYERARTNLLTFAKAQVKDQGMRYGEKYMASLWRNNV